MTHTTTDNNEPNKPRHKAGSLISRRRVVLGGSAVAAVAGLGIASLAGAATNSGTSADDDTGTSPDDGVCTLTAEATDDDYALPGALIRQDIREDKEGVQIDYTFTVVDTANDCAPLPDALVELWQCDALGEYSGFVGQNGNTEEDEDDDSTWLRGGNVTDSDGQVLFTSIWPGHYEGRAVHVHMRVHTDVSYVDETYSGGKVVHTGELFFDPDIDDTVQALSPYSDNTTTETFLDDDTVYDGDGASSGLLTIEANGADPSDGYTATLTIGVDTSASYESAEPTATSGQNDSGGTGTGDGNGTGTGTGTGNTGTSASPGSSSSGNQTGSQTNPSQSTGTTPTETVSASPSASASPTDTAVASASASASASS